MQFQYVKTNGITLHVAQDGPEDGPLVILLHGFPEFWYGWREQIQPLVEAGYRVWVPDQRGYNLSDKPKGIKDYTIDKLAADVIGLIDAAGEKQAVVIGHDWGAAVTWKTAELYPDRIKQMVAVNTPHPNLWMTAIRSSVQQLLKSHYVFLFQIPRLPETLLKRNHWQAATQSLRDSSRPGTFKEADFVEYRKAWSQPNAMTSMINWYRALRYQLKQASARPRIKIPVLIIWGDKDAFIKPELADQCLALCENGKLVRIATATHWVIHEEPTRVSELLLDFLK